MNYQVAVLLLGLSRVRILATPWSAAIWPVLGSMFMLRLVIYLYDLKYKNAPASFLHGAAYFFMLPNVVFPLCRGPVITWMKRRASARRLRRTFARGRTKSAMVTFYSRQRVFLLTVVIGQTSYRLSVHFQIFHFDSRPGRRPEATDAWRRAS